MNSYHTLVKETLEEGTYQQTRTGIKALSIFGKSISHDLSNNAFPLLTTKFVSLRLVASELEFFIKGITDKRWLQAKNNHIWDDWANPKILNEKYSFENDQLEDTLNKAYKEYLIEKDIVDTPRLQQLFSALEPNFLLESDTWKVNSNQRKENNSLIRSKVYKIAQYIERDLGPIYGFQWRHFGADYIDYKTNYFSKGYDQLQFVLETLLNDPSSRRMVISAWNPLFKHEMALEPCHYTFQLNSTNGKIDLLWSQRSIDLMLGLPFNIASYALLLKLLALESGLEERRLVGQLGNVHIYENHIDGAKEQITRTPKTLPRVTIPGFKSIFDWKGDQFKLENYEHYESIKFKIAV